MQLLTEVSHVVQVRAEGPKVPEAARPEGAEALSPGQRPGLLRTQTCRPERAKALKLQTKHKAFALTGALLIDIIPRAMPWAKSFWAFSPYLNHLRNLSCLDFDCKVRNFFLNTRCTSMTCTIVKSVKKIKGFYTHWEVFCHSAVLPPNWNNPYKCGQKCGQNPSVPPYYQYFISLFSRCLYINVEMNRHGSSFGSNNCSKRVVISVFSHFCKRWVLA